MSTECQNFDELPQGRNLLRDCLEGSTSEYYKRLFNSEGKAFLKNRHNGEEYAENTRKCYVQTFENVLAKFYGCFLSTSTFNYFKIINEKNLLDPNVTKKLHGKDVATRDCIIRIYLFLIKTASEIIKIQVKKTPQPPQKHKENENTQKLSTEPEQVQEKQEIINNIDHTIQLHNTEFNNIIPKESTNVIAGIVQFIENNTKEHKKKEATIIKFSAENAKLSTELNQEKLKLVKLSTELEQEKQKNQELHESLDETMTQLQQKCDLNLELEIENQIIKNKSPLDEFLTKAQIDQFKPVCGEESEHGFLYCGRKDIDRLNSHPYYKIGMTKEHIHHKRMQSALGDKYEMLSVHRLKSVKEVEKNLLRIFELKFGIPIFKKETFKCDHIVMRKIITAYITHHSLLI